MRAEPLPDSATRELHLMMRQRESLRAPFRTAWDDLATRWNEADLDAWSAAVLELVNINAGPGCLIAFWDISRSEPGNDIAALLAAAGAAAEICREAGARAAALSLKSLPIARNAFASAPELARWWRALTQFAHDAPDAVEPVAQRMSTILAPGSVEAFENFIASGLKLAGTDRRVRRNYFTLQHELAQRLISRDFGGVDFAETERHLKVFVTALWGRVPLFRALPCGDTAVARRSALAGPLIRLPEVYRGFEGDEAWRLYRAAAAHAQAHLVLGSGRFPVGKLKPLQIVLVGLIEDARIEMLAMRQLPGLRRLWAPFHTAKPAGIATAQALLARLARALFDDGYPDDHGFIEKGRALFAAAQTRLDDPAIAREIGMLLGNDLGQMRLQFNAKSHVVEPVYRDDNLGLWDFDEAPQANADILEMFVDAARLERQENDGAPPDDQQPSGSDAGKARPVAPDSRGTALATYPEWDRRHGIERPEWTTVRDVAALRGDPRRIVEALDRADALRGRVAQLVRGLRIGRSIRLSRQPAGHDLDLDAVIDAGLALRTGQEPDPRVFRSSTSKHRDLAALLLIDTSQSTSDRLRSGATVLDVERIAVAVLAEAMQKLGDPFGLLAFASDGRDDVKLTSVKAFNEPYGTEAMARLDGLASGYSTRLGTVLRHAGAVIGDARSFRKLVLVLTDGEPSDVDVGDPADLIEDARRAAMGLHARGIDAFGVVLGSPGMTAAARIFGRGNTMLVHRVEDLPARLSELYFRLARR
ncbi:VWA domain-containing protein [Rhodopseudomonas sp. BR0M22]|uniref:nitric oxide reductase activation protein NorD n=1 Tax=Rhodopseudomonas sp. BR0M22 TaxID=2269369 RepID=UPI0013E056BB|nr:VWA domain-containing protein [Rhodopseudomonas sp. BR0M22]NEW93810.1 VWA domain-containing protein [Rhodopseudomonas sp. BR0M22]